MMCTKLAQILLRMSINPSIHKCSKFESKRTSFKSCRLMRGKVFTNKDGLDRFSFFYVCEFQIATVYVFEGLFRH